jgi:hypothetical protein
MRFLSQRKISEVPGNWHEDFVLHIAKILRPKVYVELGLYQCHLFNQIIPYADQLFGADIEVSAGEFMNKTDKTTFYHGKTDDFAKELSKQNTKIDLLFIDADHSKEAVKKDFENYFPLVSDQGIILFHDAYPKNTEFTKSNLCGDGYLAIDEISKNSKDYEIMTIPVHPGLAICRKRKKQLAWL